MSRALLCIMHARRMAEPMAAFSALDCDRAWITGYTMRELCPVFNGIVRDTDYDFYVLCADDVVVNQGAWDAVVRELEAGHPAVSGYVPLLHGDDVVSVCRQPILTPVRRSSYDWMTRREVLDHPDDPVPAHFLGMALTGMPRDMWQQFPHRCYRHKNPRGHASDHNLSIRLRDAGIPMVVPKDAEVDHLKMARGLRVAPDWRGDNLGEQRLFVGEVEPHVRWERVAEAVA